ncbi:MAG: hypothetical protein HY809_06010 [Nitrospirae bacterium]|nr:hypothetical protein [Nitrospirota bacterium]
MLAYKKYVTIKEPGNIVLTGLPLRSGQRVEVVVIAEEELDARIQNLQALLKETQGLPVVKAISDEAVAEEIAAYRAGR